MMALAVAFFAAVAAIIGALIYAHQRLSPRGLIILGVSLGTLFVVAIAGVLLYSQIRSIPGPVTDYAESSLFQSEQDALFALGQPSAVLETDDGKAFRFDRKWYRQYVTVGQDGVSRTYVERNGNYFPAPRLFGVNGDQNFDQAISILGEPSETIIDTDGVGRILIFEAYNIFLVFSTRDRMEAIGLFSGEPVEFSELLALRP